MEPSFPNWICSGDIRSISTFTLVCVCVCMCVRACVRACMCVLVPSNAFITANPLPAIPCPPRSCRYLGMLRVFDFSVNPLFYTKFLPSICSSAYNEPSASDYNLDLIVPYDDIVWYTNATSYVWHSLQLEQLKHARPRIRMLIPACMHACDMWMHICMCTLRACIWCREGLVGYAAVARLLWSYTHLTALLWYVEFRPFSLRGLLWRPTHGCLYLRYIVGESNQVLCYGCAPFCVSFIIFMSTGR